MDKSETPSCSSNEKKKLKLLLKSVAGVAICAVGCFGYQKYKEEQHRIANDALADKLMQTDFTHYYDMHECSSEPFAATDLIEKGWDESVSAVIYPEKLDLSTPGEKQVDFLLKFKDDMGEVHRKVLTKTITARDTLKPEIKMAASAVDVWQYAGFDASDYIESVKDVVDGDMSKADELAPGKYTVSGDVDTNTPGDYTVTIKAQDTSGNEIEKSLSVAVHQIPVQVVQQVTQQAAYGGGYGGYSNYSSYSPIYAGGTNFDSYYGVMASDGNAQAIVNSGNIARIGEDYFHHNDSAFMSQFWGTQAGDTVTLNGTNYTCTGIGHGYLGDDRRSLYTDDGTDIYLDGNPNLITCDGDPGTGQRWIMYLEEQP